jgi:hypothetical protein
MVPGTPAQEGPLLDNESDYAGHNPRCQPGRYARFLLRAWARWDYEHYIQELFTSSRWPCLSSGG